MPLPSFRSSFLPSSYLTREERRSLVVLVFLLALGFSAARLERVLPFLGPRPDAALRRLLHENGARELEAKLAHAGDSPEAVRALNPGRDPERFASTSQPGPPASTRATSKPRPAKKPAPTGPVDLNRATAADLQHLPGIGPKTALLIVEERRRRGGFASLDALLDLKGIGPKKLDKIRGQLVISTRPAE